MSRYAKRQLQDFATICSNPFMDKSPIAEWRSAHLSLGQTPMLETHPENLGREEVGGVPSTVCTPEREGDWKGRVPKCSLPKGTFQKQGLRSSHFEGCFPSIWLHSVGCTRTSLDWYFSRGQETHLKWVLLCIPNAFTLTFPTRESLDFTKESPVKITGFCEFMAIMQAESRKTSRIRKRPTPFSQARGLAIIPFGLPGRESRRGTRRVSNNCISRLI